MNCQACRREIEESDGTRALNGSAGAHLESCAECRAFADEQAALRRLIGSLEVVAAPADFDFRLRARLAGLKSDGAQRGARLRFAPGAWSLALAASFVLLIAVGLVFKQTWLSPGSTTPLHEVASARSTTQTSPALVPTRRPDEAANLDPGSVIAATNGSPHAAMPPRDNSVKTYNAPPRNPVNDPNILASDSANTSATNYLPPGIPDPTRPIGTIIAVPVATSRKSATLTLYQSARPQTVSLRPVTFGAQDVIEQGDAQPTLVSSAQGVW
ncbi:MAG: hypothetical protein JO360_08000 [Acidobacteria bacterium]|nr:hypothetical protein [Acidobacteriota bacterium]